MAKKCARCSVIKSDTSFYPRKNAKDGLRGWCKECCSFYQSTIRREVIWARNLWYRFGITPDDFDKMFIQQNGRCALCGRPEPDVQYGRTRKLNVDHDHKTGRVRGLLCVQCNTLLGHLEKMEMSGFFEKAREYRTENK